jgi:iron-sulfur cluster assembly protein
MNTDTKMTMTPAALQHLRRKIDEQGYGAGLRIGLKTRGCSGLAYELSIVAEAGATEQVFPQNDGLFVCVPAKDLPFVIGTTIDYVREGLQANFRFHNPHEVASCGCGESFTVNSESA